MAEERVETKGTYKRDDGSRGASRDMSHIDGPVLRAALPTGREESGRRGRENSTRHRNER